MVQSVVKVCYEGYGYNMMYSYLMRVVYFYGILWLLESTSLYVMLVFLFLVALSIVYRDSALQARFSCLPIILSPPQYRDPRTSYHTMLCADYCSERLLLRAYCTVCKRYGVLAQNPTLRIHFAVG